MASKAMGSEMKQAVDDMTEALLSVWQALDSLRVAYESLEPWLPEAEGKV
jgi:hypothetical protein